MKNFPRTVKVCAATGLVILSILIVQACTHHIADGSGKRFELAFEKRTQVKDPEGFCNTLKKDLSSSAIYSFEVVFDNGKSENCCQPIDCSAKNLRVKVDKITTSRMAEASASELTPIGSHVTQRIYSNVNGDIATVLAQAKAESP